jgi:serine/threonine protein kinase
MQKPLYFNPSISVSEEAKNLIRECLTIDEDHRITLKEMEVAIIFTTNLSLEASFVRKEEYDSCHATSTLL